MLVLRPAVGQRHARLLIAPLEFRQLVHAAEAAVDLYLMALGEVLLPVLQHLLHARRVIAQGRLEIAVHVRHDHEAPALPRQWT